MSDFQIFENGDDADRKEKQDTSLTDFMFGPGTARKESARLDADFRRNIPPEMLRALGGRPMNWSEYKLWQKSGEIPPESAETAKPGSLAEMIWHKLDIALSGKSRPAVSPLGRAVMARLGLPAK